MWWAIAAAVGIVMLVHTLPAPFLLDAMAGERSVWHMPRSSPPTIYLTYDDGPNPSTTPALLDALGREGVHATFFLINEHVAEDTAPLIRRMFAEGHAVALHSGRRWDLFRSSDDVAHWLTSNANRIESLAGWRPCRAFRPHGGWRSRSMYKGLQQIDYRLIGWGWMLWDVDPLHARTADRIVDRIAPRVRAGDIVVMHDGDEKAPRAPRPQTVEATSRIIPLLRQRGFAFGTVCNPGIRNQESEMISDS